MVAADWPVHSVQDKILLLGLGAWGKTILSVLNRQGFSVRIWQRHQGPLTPGQLEPIQIIISTLPIQGVRGIAQQVQALNLPPGRVLISATKGLEPQTAATATQIWTELLPQAQIVVLSGPNLAAEINQGLPAAAVIGGDLEIAAQAQSLFAMPTFRVYTNPDRRGVELGGVLKNVMAIACGVNDGLGLGVNARSALITRGLLEMVRVGTHWGGDIQTFYGLSGLGDLLATCTSPLSRNYQVGWHLAQGTALKDALERVIGTAEGVNTALVLSDYAQAHDLDVPITQAVTTVLRDEVTPQQALTQLLERPFKVETLDH
ncbi:NAD(P)H-dependent glycerol-3-phosphate dehydrogenase [Thermosynechococcaceae cyanobacterium BACA0444]|uniref:Glycerol-3-phosphate dehydrogenase [NAD(P)+] n=1 Tax=Pseudocalidococcus azoricus BACA0444 TaxID=2918990 RepID=A0AAE4JUX1_9CYAN|nr:NAD(P)H-dependent glycerol-3-phosphate dehydrogenase [Pseudocalidococcus azoricus]MDS3859740.1 NAD(P)H-dependent glycerol-3-phosphate dehydrogenase [Pseudocalidococcus azoricus BACA0444]